MKPLLTVLIACCTHMFPAAALGQVVIARTVDAETGRPVAGVFLTLTDSAGRRAAAALSNASGHMVLRVAPGVFTANASLIGFEPWLQHLTLQKADTVRVELPLRYHAIPLDQVEARGERECRGHPETAASTARLWQDIEAALRVAVWLDDGYGVFRGVRIHQPLDMQLRAAGEPELEFVNSIGRNAFESSPVDSLIEFGFARPLPNGRIRYNGPDAPLLLSDRFLNSYCFGITRDRDRPGLVSLSFEPKPDQRVSGIRGNLWVSEKTSELQYVEYQFTGLGIPLDAQRLAGGRTDFIRLHNGAWIIPRWEIRSPRPVPSGSYYMLAATNTVGELLGFALADEPPELVKLSGTVFDSLTFSYARTGKVVVLGTKLTVPVGPDGTFQIDSLVPGVYYLALEHPHLQRLPKQPLPTRVVVRDSAAPVSLAVPSRATSLGRFCSDEQMARGKRWGHDPESLGMLSGIVLQDESAIPPKDLRIRLRWRNEEGDGWEEAVEDDGTFLICAVPEDFDLFIEVRHRRAPLYRTGPTRLTYGFGHVPIGLPRR